MPGPYHSGHETFGALSDVIGREARAVPDLIITSRKSYDEAVRVKPFTAPATGRHYLFGIEFYFVPDFDGAAALEPRNEEERAELIKAAETRGIHGVIDMMTGPPSLKVTGTAV